MPAQRQPSGVRWAFAFFAAMILIGIGIAAWVVQPAPDTYPAMPTAPPAMSPPAAGVPYGSTNVPVLPAPAPVIPQTFTPLRDWPPPMPPLPRVPPVPAPVWPQQISRPPYPLNRNDPDWDEAGPTHGSRVTRDSHQ